MNKYIIKNNNNNAIIQKVKNSKYLGKSKLLKDSNCFVSCKTYCLYHIELKSKNNVSKLLV